MVRSVVHIVTKLEMGGAQGNTLFSAEYAAREGWRAAVIASRGPLSEDAAALQGVEYLETPLLRREPRPLTDLRALAFLRRYLREARPDVVHTHSSKAGILGRLASKLEGVPAIVHTAHGWGFNDLQIPPKRLFFEAAERRASRWCDRIIAVAHANVEKALSRGIGRPEQFTVIRSGVDIESIKSARYDRERTRRELGIPDTAIIVLMPANLKPQKAPEDFAKAATILADKHPEIHFLVAGDGPGRNKVERIVERAGLGRRFRILSWRRDVLEIMASSDIIVLTSLFEGLPRVFIEAAALGLPSVGTAVDGTPEIIEDGLTGILTRPRDAEGTAKAVSRLAGDEDLRRRMGRAARERLRDEFDIRIMAKRIMRLYDELLERISVTPTA